MKRLLLALLVFGGAHAPPPEPEAEAPPVEQAKPFEMSADVTPPRRKGCRLKGPRLAAKDRPSGSVVVNYQVSAEGKVSDVAVEGDANARAIKAVRRYLESCTYAPATRAGAPVAVRWKGELAFPTRAPASR